MLCACLGLLVIHQHCTAPDICQGSFPRITQEMLYEMGLMVDSTPSGQCVYVCSQTQGAFRPTGHLEGQASVLMVP